MAILTDNVSASAASAAPTCIRKVPIGVDTGHGLGHPVCSMQLTNESLRRMDPNEIRGVAQNSHFIPRLLKLVALQHAELTPTGVAVNFRSTGVLRCLAAMGTRSSKPASFHRQMSLYGFTKIPGRGVYHFEHPVFRENVAMHHVLDMVRKRPTAARTQDAGDAATHRSPNARRRRFDEVGSDVDAETNRKSRVRRTEAVQDSSDLRDTCTSRPTTSLQPGGATKTECCSDIRPPPNAHFNRVGVFGEPFQYSLPDVCPYAARQSRSTSSEAWPAGAAADVDGVWRDEDCRMWMAAYD